MSCWGRASPTINPRTGKIWRLTDAEIAPEVEAFQKAIDSPDKALRLHDGAGFRRKNPVQIALINMACIEGCFRLPLA